MTAPNLHKKFNIVFSLMGILLLIIWLECELRGEIQCRIEKEIEELNKSKVSSEDFTSILVLRDVEYNKKIKEVEEKITADCSIPMPTKKGRHNNEHWNRGIIETNLINPEIP